MSKREHPRPSEEHIQRTHEIVEFLLPALREVARSGGWALATHGSMERDIDVVLIPWREFQPIEVEYVVGQFFKVCRLLCSATWSGKKYEDEETPPPEHKSHGRLSWAIMLGGPYLDISAWPCPSEAKTEEPAK